MQCGHVVVAQRRLVDANRRHQLVQQPNPFVVDLADAQYQLRVQCARAVLGPLHLAGVNQHHLHVRPRCPDFLEPPKLNLTKFQFFDNVKPIRKMNCMSQCYALCDK